jgi:long-chain acyl-CoA synthetase
LEHVSREPDVTGDGSTEEPPGRASARSLTDLLELAVHRHPQRCAVTAPNGRLSYADLDAAANRVAHFLLDRGVRPGDAVALLALNVAEFVPLYFGILKVGGTVVPLNVLLDARALAQQLHNSGARLLLCVEGRDGTPAGATARAAAARVPSCREVIVVGTDAGSLSTLTGDCPTTPPAGAPSPDDVALVVYPSRTPGVPKGIELTHAALLYNAQTVTSTLSGPDPDVHLVVLPLFHLVTQAMQLHAGIATGSTLVLLPRFEPEAALRAMTTCGVTAVVAVPTMLWALTTTAAKHPAQARRVRHVLRLVCSALAPLPPAVGDAVADQFGVTVLEGYGLSESGMIALHARPGDPAPGSVGRPVDGVEIRLVDTGERVIDGVGTGEIQIRSPGLMRGYRRDPSATSAAMREGWFSTGDLARRRPDGTYAMDDRPKRMVLRSGLAVYPRSVEEALLTHPAVSTATVVGVPHERHGEELRTVIERRPGAVVSDAELVAWARQQLPAFTGEVEIRDAPAAPGSPRPRPVDRLRRVLPGLALAACGTALAFAVNRLLPALGTLTVAVVLGAVLANTVGVPAAARPGLATATRRLLRAGVVLLGLQLSIPEVAGLGAPMLAVVVATVGGGFLGTLWIGRRLGLPSDLTLLTATGFSICGASAIAAMQGATDADEDDVAASVALVTIFGSIALVLWPLLQAPLGLPDEAYGAWAGASVHEVAQVVAAASPAGAAALATAVVVKLSRVVLLAPLLAVVSWRRRGTAARGADTGRRPRLIPLFVAGFLAAIVVRSTGLLGDAALDVAKSVTTILLAAALFGLGSSVRVRVLAASGPGAISLGMASTVLLAVIAFMGIQLAGVA